MKLRVFVEESQMADRGLLTVGDLVGAYLWGLPSDYLTFHVPKGTKLLRQTGIFEYLVGGEIKQVRSYALSDHPGHISQLVWLDCGLPVTIDHIGWGPLALRGPLEAAKEVTPSSGGTYIGGVIFLMAEISFVSRRLAPSIEARVRAIEVLWVGRESVIQREEVQEVNFSAGGFGKALGAILEIEV